MKYIFYIFGLAPLYNFLSELYKRIVFIYLAISPILIWFYKILKRITAHFWPEKKPKFDIEFPAEK